jgi:hypothetical protein
VIGIETTSGNSSKLIRVKRRRFFFMWKTSPIVLRNRIHSVLRKLICHLGLALLILDTSFSRPWAQQSNTGEGTSAFVAQKKNIEDWNILSLAGSDLRPEKPLLGARDEFPQFTRELFQVQWRAGDPIDLYVIRPKGTVKPPVVLYLYSYPSESDRFRDNDYCTRLTQDGLAAVGFVSALTGQRYSMRPMKEWFISELQESLVSSVHDVQMILNFLSQRDDLDMSRVGMFGTGSGATIAILSAAVDPRIKAVDLLTPWGDWPDWLAQSSLIPENERPKYLKPEFLKRVESFDPLRHLPELTSQQVRIQNVADDIVTPKVSQEKLKAAAPSNAKVQTFENTRQFFAAAAGGRIFDWMKTQLRAKSETTSVQTDTAAKRPLPRTTLK